MSDHLALFYLLDVGHTYTDQTRAHSSQLASVRSLLLMVAEGVSSLTKVVSVVLFLQVINDSSIMRTVSVLGIAIIRIAA